MSATVMQRAIIQREGSLSNHLERRALALRLEINAVVSQLSQNRDGKPGPKAGAKALRDGITSLDATIAAIRRVAPTIDDLVR